MAEQQDFDLVISGGGATGWSLILALQTLLPADKRLKVALIDSFDPSQSQSHPGFDARAIALSRQTLHYFQRLGVDAEMSAKATAIHTIHVSDKGASGQVLLKHTDYQEHQLGMVTEAHELGTELLKCAQKRCDSHSQLSLITFQPDNIISAETHRDHILLKTKTGQALRASLLVLAEGSRSASRDLFDLNVTQQDYRQHAIIANVVTEKPPQNTAFERFTESGPLAFLPMSQQRCGVVWSVNEHDFDGVMAMNDADFIRALQQQFGFRLGTILKAGKRQSYPLSLITTDDQNSHRLASIGNAAQTLHPIAGQGFNLAIRDAWQLAENIAESVRQSQDIGQFKRIAAYKKCRKQDKHNSILLTDSLVHLFSNNNPLLTAGRNIGLLLMNNTPVLKDAFARIAMGQRNGVKQ